MRRSRWLGCWLLVLVLAVISCGSERPAELQAVLDDNPELSDLDLQSGRRVRRVLETGAPDPLYGWEGDIYVYQIYEAEVDRTIDDVIDEIVSEAEQLGWVIDQTGETIQGGRSVAGCNAQTRASIFATTTLPSSPALDRVAFFLTPGDCTLEGNN